MVNIKSLFKKTIEKENPQSKYWFYPASGYHIIDMPRNHKLHGSSVAFKCNTKCEVVGDIITYDDPEIIEGMTKRLGKLRCKHLGTHHHGLLHPEAHIHINCKKMSKGQVKKLMDLVKFF